MLVCNVSLRPRRGAIAADVAEFAAASDASTIGALVLATLVDDPANVLDTVDAYLGDIMLETATAADSVSGSVAVVYSADISEALTATDTQSATIPISSVTLDPSTIAA